MQWSKTIGKTAGAAALAAVLATGGLASGGASAESWDMPTPYPDATFHTQNIMQFAEDVKEATDGALEITVHSAGSLFKHPEIKNAVRSRQVPIGEFFLSLLTNENAAFGIDSQPFLATTYEQAEALWRAQAPVVTELLAEQDLMPLYAVAWPPQGLYTKEPVETVEDLKGIKFRSYNAALEKFAQLAGMAPTQVEVPDIPQAFATGRVEAMITSPSTGANSKAWDFVEHYYDIKAWVPKNIVVVNRKAFRALDESVQTAVLNAAKAAESRGWQMSQEETQAKTDMLSENGMEVHQPSEALMQGLKQIGEEMIADWKAEAGPAGERILEAYQAD
ncbi:TRAP transporter substrate-binding protein [Marivibrio halodurans]|uniref:TRAP transporter substrate-binding protein n=1 Tax=Marivibrio halodurans TaxID=2039722 RepID=A0A8J7V2V8_9PROT|nr:TRAP transporter substrate-binding protein [Marivibrio halodurans]MBP5857745.1 TRAP transporter substrate-binding protein [Marivibrio halodurans]